MSGPGSIALPARAPSGLSSWMPEPSSRAAPGGILFQPQDRAQPGLSWQDPASLIEPKVVDATQRSTHMPDRWLGLQAALRTPTVTERPRPATSGNLGGPCAANESGIPLDFSWKAVPVSVSRGIKGSRAGQTWTLTNRGLQNALTGKAYALVHGTDGRLVVVPARAVVQLPDQGTS